MKSPALLLASLAVIAGLCAQEPKSSYTVTSDTSYVSRYVFRGVQLAKDSFQSSLAVTSGPFTAGLWTNQPIIQKIDNEFDLYGTYDIPLGERWKASLGGTIYYYPELDERTGADKATYEPKLGLAGALGPVSTALTLYQDVTLKATTGELTLGYSRLLEGMSGSFDLSGTGGRTSPDLGGSYNYYSLGGRFTFRPRENLTLYVGGAWTRNNLGAGRSQNVGFAGVTLSL